MIGNSMIVVGAVSDSKILELLERFFDYLTLSSLAVDTFRKVMWSLLRGLATVLDAITGSQRQVLDLLNFYKSDAVQKFIGPFEPVFIALAGLAAVIAFISSMRNKDTTLSKIMNNLVLAFIIFFGLPFMTDTLAGIGSGLAKQVSYESSSSISSFRTNITDIYTVDQLGWKKLDKGYANDIFVDNDLKYLDITEVVDMGDGFFFDDSPLSDDGKEVLGKKISQIEGKKTLANLSSNFFSRDDVYMRYSWHPWYILVELVCRTLVAYFLIYKLIRMIYELGIFTTVFRATALTDLKDGERNIKMLTQLKNTFLVIVLVFVNQAFFDLMWTVVKEQGYSHILNLGILIPLTIATIDGPNFIEQFFGMDAGLSSATQGILALTHGASSLRNLASGAGNVAKGAVKGASKVAGASVQGLGMAGAGVKGALDGLKETPPPPTDKPDLPKDRTPPTEKGGDNQESDLPPTADLPPENSPEHDDMKDKAQETLNRQKGRSMKENVGGKSKDALNGFKGERDKPLPPVPPSALPPSVREAGEHYKANQEPSQPETLKDKAVDSYVDSRQRMASTKPMQRMKKSYEVSRDSVRDLKSKGD